MLALDNIEMAVCGYGSSEHGAAFREAVTLCRGLRNGHGPVGKLLARALHGDAIYRLHTGQVGAAEFAPARAFPKKQSRQALIAVERARRLRHLPTMATCLIQACDVGWILRERCALAELAGIGVILCGPHIRSMLAEVYAGLDLRDRALQLIDEALDVCARTSEGQTGTASL
jgi:hypothetical protein